MEGEHSVKTVVDCLRDRLLAERQVSRNAKEETEQLEHKIMELEKMLKQEAKSRNRAEKKLKLLIKKLEYNHISDASDYSGLVGKSDISPPSSTDSLETQETEKSEQGSDQNNNLLQKSNSLEFLFSLNDDNSSTIEVGSSSGSDSKGQERCEMESPGSPDLSDNFEEKNISQNPIVENLLFSQKSDLLGFDQNCDDSKMGEPSDICYHGFRFSTKDGLNNDQDDKSCEPIDNSMTLVAVEAPQKNWSIDPVVLDSAVKEVLDALKRAKEQLQSSIDKRGVNMIGVG